MARRRLARSCVCHIPLSELGMLEEEFYSDHLHIINYFISIA